MKSARQTKMALSGLIMPCIAYLTGLHVAMCSWWVVGDTITVRCGGQSVILDKARDLVTAKESQWSNPLSKEKNFKKKIREFKKDKLWKRMQNPQCQRNPGTYEAAFRTGA